MKVLYDEGTSEEKWWIGVAVEKLSEESHRSTFLKTKRWQQCQIASARSLMRKPVVIVVVWMETFGSNRRRSFSCCCSFVWGPEPQREKRRLVS